MYPVVSRMCWRITVWALGVLLMLSLCLPQTVRAIRGESTALPETEISGPCPLDIVQTLKVPPRAKLVLSQPTQVVPRLCGLELTIVVQSGVTNPYDPAQIDVRVRFTSPARQVVVVSAFYYAHPQDNGKRGWRARFTPALTGRWSAVAEAVTAAGRWHSQRIVFTVSPRNAPGFVRVSSVNPRYLIRDGEPQHTFFPIGLNLGWWRDGATSDYAHWLDALQQNGGTVARIWLAPWSFGLEWQDTGLGNFDRQVRAFWLDQVIDMAQQRGIYLILGLIPDRDFISGQNGLWADNPYNAANGGPVQTPQEFVTNLKARAYFKRYLRYIVARWGYSPNILAWEYWNEVESTRIETPELKPWIEDMATVLREFDVNHHLTTISYVGNGDDAIWRMPEIDLMQHHEYSQTPKWFNFLPGGVRLSPGAPAKPLVFGEFGFSSAGETLTPATQDGIHLHNGLWASVFSGFASSALYWWWDDYVDAGNLWFQFKGIARFLADEDVAAFTATPVTVSMPHAKPSITPPFTALALTSPNRALVWIRNSQYNQSDVSAHYLITQSTGAPFSLRLDALRGVTVTLSGLPDGAYRVTWLDTLTGEPLSTAAVNGQAGHLTLTAPPFVRDVAAKISR